MTICKVTGMACNCQPDEGVPCDGEKTLKEGFHGWRNAALKAEKQASELRAEVERRGDVIRGHEATLTRLQGDLLRAGLKLEASRLECEKLSQALASSCDDERSQLWESTTGGGCSRAIAAEAECERLRVGALSAMREYARKNPRHHFGEGLQDPCGVHAWLEQWDKSDAARSAASGESAEGGT